MNSPSSSAPRSMFDLWIGSGMWSEVASDRKGLRCAEQLAKIEGATLRAYFDDGGKLEVMMLEQPTGERTEMPAEQVLALTAMARRELAAELGQTFTRGPASRFTGRR